MYLVNFLYHALLFYYNFNVYKGVKWVKDSVENMFQLFVDMFKGTDRVFHDRVRSFDTSSCISLLVSIFLLYRDKHRSFRFFFRLAMAKHSTTIQFLFSFAWNMSRPLTCFGCDNISIEFSVHTIFRHCY